MGTQIRKLWSSWCILYMITIKKNHCWQLHGACSTRNRKEHLSFAGRFAFVLCALMWSKWPWATNAMDILNISWQWDKKCWCHFEQTRTHTHTCSCTTAGNCVIVYFLENVYEYPHAVDGADQDPPEDVANAATIRDAVDKLSSGVAC